MLADSLQNLGWTCAWADYDEDGDLDVVLASPNGFSTTKPNRLFRNLGGDAFEYDLSTDVTNGLAPYTAVTWNDFDLDGDMDMYIGAGPANGSLAADYAYRNQTIEGGSPRLKRITTPGFATDARDGQVGNFIDYDNDGDQDLYVTNWGGASGRPNDFYRNENGTLIKKTAAQVGPIASDGAHSLANVWGDYDNDGDLDCVVTKGDPAPVRYYRNRNDGTFESAALGALTSDAGPHWGACNGDYDDDGDLDLFVHGGTNKALFRNDTGNGNHWLELRLIGMAPNTSAIGARIRLKATIGGVARWQMREVLAANSFGGQNSLRVHFGLGNAESAESLVVLWPDGLVETTTVANADTCLVIPEGSLTPTPAQFSPGSAIYGAGVVSLEWWVFGTEARVATLERTRGDVWEPLASVEAAEGGHYHYVDAQIASGARYGYRLGVLDFDGPVYSAPVWVSVPSLAFALETLHPSPTRSGRSFVIYFSFPSTGSAKLDVIDVRGRVVAHRELSGLGAGPHTVEIGGPGTALAPGVYHVRLTHGAHEARKRVVVVP